MASLLLKHQSLRIEAIHPLLVNEGPLLGARQRGGSPLHAAFAGFAELLGPRPSPEAYDTLTEAARGILQAAATWLLLPDGDRWRLVGHAMSDGLPADAVPPESELQMIPLMSGGKVQGLLAYWPLVTRLAPADQLVTLFEAALAGLLRTREALDEYERQATHDPLTGLPNRRALESDGQRMLALSRRTQRPLSVLMIDLDHFKDVNDSHGHEAGDMVLKAFAGALGSELRESDLPARYGGEEFLVVLPDTTAEEAVHVADKIRSATENLAVEVRDGATIRFTVSIGVAGLRPADDLEGLVARADGALYRAKSSGRNRSVLDD